MKKFFNYKNKTIDAVLKNLSSFVIFGASSSGIPLKKVLGEAGFDALAFMDNDKNKIGREIDGLMVHSPDDIHMFDLSHILIGCSYGVEIKKQLDEKGFKGIVLDFCFVHEKVYSRHYDAGLIETSSERIKEARSMLLDEKSKTLFDSLIEYRKTLNPSFIEYSPEHYLDKRMRILSGSTVLDIGAYDGDTALIFSDIVGDNGKIYAFEPVKETYEKLREQAVNAKRKNITAVNSGIWIREGVMHINTSSANRVGSMISSSGNEEIRVTTIDKYVNENGIKRVDLIKMDIEGAEREALEGARQTVKAHEPNLAISIYHKPDDLWEIPILIKNMNPKYKLFLSHHSQSLGETVCYATIFDIKR